MRRHQLASQLHHKVLSKRSSTHPIHRTNPNNVGILRASNQSKAKHKRKLIDIDRIQLTKFHLLRSFCARYLRWKLTILPECKFLSCCTVNASLQNIWIFAEIQTYHKLNSMHARGKLTKLILWRWILIKHQWTLLASMTLVFFFAFEASLWILLVFTNQITNILCRNLQTQAC